MTPGSPDDSARAAAVAADLALAQAREGATSEILRVINESPGDLQRVLDVIAQHAARLCDALDVEVFRVEGETVHLAAGFGPLYEETRRTVENTSWIIGGPQWERGAHVSVPGRAIIERHTVVVDDLTAVPRTDLEAGVARRLGIRSLAATPMLRDAEVVGLISVRRLEARPFTPADVHLLETFAQQAVIALENVQRMTQLRQQNAALAEASRLKSAFLATMTHELRTPLNAILGFSDLLLDEPPGGYDADRRTQYLETIRSSGNHLLGLINDVLDLAKIEAGRMELRPERVSVAGVVSGVLAAVEPLARRKEIVLEPLNCDAGTVMAEERKVTQVLYNLLSNAIKFTPDGGHVTVEAQRGPAAVRFTVSDTGIGIAPEDQARIFDEFEQVDSGPGRCQTGTGLGLGLSRRLVELHGGQVWVDSRPGEGSRFHFTLPLTAEALPTFADGFDPQSVAPGSAPGSALASAPLVLAIEDDPNTAAVLRLYLSRAGFRVHVLEDGRGAVPLACELRPAAITLDVLLPGENGWAILGALKANPMTRAIPVIVVSNVDDRERAAALGAADHLVKPVDRHALLASLSRQGVDVS